MEWPTAEEYGDVRESVLAFNQGLRAGQGLLEDRLSYFRQWYYVPELDAVGPSKFIGYKGMTAEEYGLRKGLDGRDTEAVLKQRFDVLDEKTPEGEYVRSKVEGLLAQHNKNLNQRATFHAPHKWKLNKAGPVSWKSSVTSETPAPGPRPMVEVVINLPKRLLDYADRLAGERATTRSGVIADLLEKEEQARIRALMEEGYREMVEENRRLAEEAFPLASEMLKQHTRWDERADG